MKPSLTKKIIFDYFDGKHSSIQSKMIEDWLKVKENQELFYLYLDEWEAEHPQYLFDTKKGSLNISERIQNRKNESEINDHAIAGNRFNFKYLWLAALVLVVGAWIGFHAYTKNAKVSYNELVSDAKMQSGEMYEHENMTAEPQFIRLPDESSVILQPRSKISYSPHTYNQNKREVILSGEAFFEVQKDLDAPFFVYANDLITKVLGTSFTVKANDVETEVTVQTGRVEVILQNDVDKKKKIEGKAIEGLVLSANEHLKINVNHLKNELPIIVKQSKQLQPIQKLTFDFDDTPAIEIIEALKKAYHIEISYNPEKLRNCNLTAHLTDEPLIEKIKLICIALEAEYEERDNTFIIKSNGCN
jgi:hypothetical protein